MSTFIVNGEIREVSDALTVGDLLDRLSVSHQTVAVMVNGAIIAREAFGTESLHERDAIEIVRFVGGG